MVADLTAKVITTTKRKETPQNQKGRGENSSSPIITDESLFDKIIPSKKQTLYTLLLFIILQIRFLYKAIENPYG